MSQRIAIVDYGMGNLRSVQKALVRVAPGDAIEITADAGAVGRADRVIFPGQGAMPDCMRQLAASGAREAVIEAAGARPFLGICIGLQMLFERGEEGDTAGLGLLAGSVPRFPALGLKIPHMGWNEVIQARPHPLWQGIADRSRFYFVHSYYAIPDDASVVVATTEYPDAFACALAQDNVFAVQFHPEKSQAVGLQLLNNFLHWDGQV